MKIYILPILLILTSCVALDVEPLLEPRWELDCASKIESEYISNPFLELRKDGKFCILSHISDSSAVYQVIRRSYK